jgi:hypothetical protein
MRQSTVTETGHLHAPVYMFRNNWDTLVRQPTMFRKKTHVQGIFLTD